MDFFKKLFKSERKDNTKVKSKEVKLSLDDLFVHNFLKKGGKFLYCLKVEEVKDNLLKIIKENKWDSILILDKELKSFFDENKLEIHSKNNSITPLFTSCEHLIAENGDIMFSSNQLGSEKLNKFSDNFIVLATTSQIVKNTGQGLTGIKANSKSTLPTNISSIRNYQINKNDDNFLNYGNSNSKKLYLLLLENL